LPSIDDMAEWILREGSKSHFRYRRSDGRLVRDARTLERIRLLAIPPAWTDVHIAVSPRNAVQAWGMDAKSRKQYRYHTRAVEQGQLRKYYRVRELAKELPELRRRIRRDAASREPSRHAVAAAVVQLVSESFFRIGSERYFEENRTSGIATLLKRHVEIADGRATFTYVGKRSIRQRQIVANRSLARLVARHLESPGARLFRYRDGRQWRDLTARDVNGYLRDRLGVPFSAKDFRTWGGTLEAALAFAEHGPPASAADERRTIAAVMRRVGAELGNTPAVARSSYVSPAVVEQWRDGRTLEDFRERRLRVVTVRGLENEEAALLSLLRSWRIRRSRAAA
jgi:DNA topoisomerase-1